MYFREFFVDSFFSMCYTILVGNICPLTKTHLLFHFLLMEKSSNTEIFSKDIIRQNTGDFLNFFDMGEMSEEIRSNTKEKLQYVIEPDALDNRKNGAVDLFH